MEQNFDYFLQKLKTSPFRAKFKLKDKEKAIAQEKGLDVLRQHAYDIVKKRLAPKDIPNDGKQTPMKNHPVFVAQHATATCCRGCLFKWWHIAQNRELTDEEIDFVVGIIMAWIENNC